MVDLVIVDYRNICKICSYSLLSGSIAAIYAPDDTGELEDIAHRIAKRLYCIRADYPEAKIILALDSPPYWRHDYINKWYNARGEEPVGYKANRASASWSFRNSKETMDSLYNDILPKISAALELMAIGDTGLEADDIWGIIAATEAQLVIRGVSSDQDWQQLCGKNISIANPTTNEILIEPLDIRYKCIAGDRGDNIMGCNKRRKNGTDGSTMWGADGAKKLIATELESEWKAKINKSVYDRNHTLIKLPCPLWNIEEAANQLQDCVTFPTEIIPEEQEKILNNYGITEPVRKLLNNAAERTSWISKLRAYLQVVNKTPKKETEDSSADDSAEKAADDYLDIIDANLDEKFA